MLAGLTLTLACSSDSFSPLGLTCPASVRFDCPLSFFFFFLVRLLFLREMTFSEEETAGQWFLGRGEVEGGRSEGIGNYNWNVLFLRRH